MSSSTINTRSLSNLTTPLLFDDTSTSSLGTTTTPQSSASLLSLNYTDLSSNASSVGSAGSDSAKLSQLGNGGTLVAGGSLDKIINPDSLKSIPDLNLNTGRSVDYVSPSTGDSKADTEAKQTVQRGLNTVNNNMNGGGIQSPAQGLTGTESKTLDKNTKNSLPFNANVSNPNNGQSQFNQINKLIDKASSADPITFDYDKYTNDLNDTKNKFDSSMTNKKTTDAFEKVYNQAMPQKIEVSEPKSSVVPSALSTTNTDNAPSMLDQPLGAVKKAYEPYINPLNNGVKNVNTSLNSIGKKYLDVGQKTAIKINEIPGDLNKKADEYATEAAKTPKGYINPNGLLSHTNNMGASIAGTLLNVPANLNTLFNNFGNLTVDDGTATLGTQLTQKALGLPSTYASLLGNSFGVGKDVDGFFNGLNDLLSGGEQTPVSNAIDGLLGVKNTVKDALKSGKVNNQQERVGTASNPAVVEEMPTNAKPVTQLGQGGSSNGNTNDGVGRSVDGGANNSNGGSTNTGISDRGGAIVKAQPATIVPYGQTGSSNSGQKMLSGQNMLPQTGNNQQRSLNSSGEIVSAKELLNPGNSLLSKLVSSKSATPNLDLFADLSLNELTNTYEKGGADINGLPQSPSRKLLTTRSGISPFDPNTQLLTPQNINSLIYENGIDATQDAKAASRIAQMLFEGHGDLHSSNVSDTTLIARLNTNTRQVLANEQMHEAARIRLDAISFQRESVYPQLMSIAAALKTAKANGDIEEVESLSRQISAVQRLDAQLEVQQRIARREFGQLQTINLTSKLPMLTSLEVPISDPNGLLPPNSPSLTQAVLQLPNAPQPISLGNNTVTYLKEDPISTATKVSKFTDDRDMIGNLGKAFKEANDLLQINLKNPGYVDKLNKQSARDVTRDTNIPVEVNVPAGIDIRQAIQDRNTGSVVVRDTTTNTINFVFNPVRTPDGWGLKFHTAYPVTQ